MMTFPGFTSSETFTQVPDSFFQLMSQISEVDELKAALIVLWRIEHIQGAQRYVARDEIAADAGRSAGFLRQNLTPGWKKPSGAGFCCERGRRRAAFMC
ncbi:MAG: hypothetical protein OHK0031_10470 [Anaerolineales bacterium]